MGKLIGYGKLGRSMPLTLEKCANLGGDVEMVAVVKEMALRHPDDTFILLGRNTGEIPTQVDMPSNIINPWAEWGWSERLLREGTPIRKKYAINPNGSNLAIQGHIEMRDLFRDITEETFVKCDGHVFWVGQHGSTNTPVPKISDPSIVTKPHDWCAYYASHILQGVNAWRDVHLNRDVIWLNADARNTHKMRDLKHPLKNPILTQYTFKNNIKHEQYDGSPPETGVVRNIYSRLEVNGLAPGTPFGDLITYNPNPVGRAYNFGMFINEARAIGVKTGMDRLSAMSEWVLPLIEDHANRSWFHGTWSQKSQDEMRLSISPAPWDQYYPTLNDTLCTFTTPSSGSGWATAKPWEAFAGGTICFFHPDYDDQDNILKDAHPGLRDWLRCKTPRDLKTRVTAVVENRNTAKWLITKQREHFDKAMTEKRYLKLIEEMIWND
jgi:hypothetical protein